MRESMQVRTTTVEGESIPAGAGRDVSLSCPAEYLAWRPQSPRSPSRRHHVRNTPPVRRLPDR